MAWLGMKIPEKKFQMQRPMLRVCYALMPLVAASVYLFGWRSLVLAVVILLFGTAAEGLFTFRAGKPITSAVFVTSLIFFLSLPPTIPFWMAIVGIVAGVVFGKMVFGGFGQNVFNPAMVGRCFIYITFPVQMTNKWASPIIGRFGGFLHWSPTVDAVSQATPLSLIHQGDSVSWANLFLGQVSGSMGETSALLILLGGAYLLYKKAAPWRLAVSCFLGGVLMSALLHYSGAVHVPDPLTTVLAGSFLFGTLFVATEPISGSKTPAGQWINGFGIGGLTVILRGFSNFPEGVMFSVLLMNSVVPLIDQTVNRVKAKRTSK